MHDITAFKFVTVVSSTVIGWVWQFTLQLAQRHNQISKIGDIFEKFVTMVSSTVIGWVWQSPDDAGRTNRQRKAATTRSDHELSCMEAANQGPVCSDLTNSELSAGIISEGGEVTLSLLKYQCLILIVRPKLMLLLC